MIPVKRLCVSVGTPHPPHPSLPICFFFPLFLFVCNFPLLSIPPPSGGSRLETLVVLFCYTKKKYPLAPLSHTPTEFYPSSVHLKPSKLYVPLLRKG